ncbi:MAG: bi-domain-containing oxidoreductase [Melioribacteraceae bacterium]|nr:bi-domain-containing oxidoreductase [Melioribacteraceae bacterium]
MLQIIQYQKTGKISVEKIPPPKLSEGRILVQNVFSLISSGTERTSVQTAQASLIGKAIARPDLVKQVISNIKSEGLFSTISKIQNRLDNYKELGYSSAGIVLESSIPDFRPGDRVACAGYAYHSEIISVPKNLAVKIEEKISFEEAAFTTLGAIALQGVRQADLSIGEYVCVIGLGLIGLITVQILKANGCRVVGIDINRDNFNLATSLGCDECYIINIDSIKYVESFTKGYGTDAVIITAGTLSNEPIEFALEYSRKKSKIVVVGSIGMNIPRSPFYEKEIDLRISCSYGPGRYDSNYEENGNDYPIAYVRWTENRNMEAVLDLMAQGKLDVIPLISHKISINDGVKAYKIITGEIKEPYLAILIEYNHGDSISQIGEPKRFEIYKRPSQVISGVEAGFVGAGNFAQSYLIPNLNKLNISLIGLATDNPVNAKTVAQKFKFNFATTETAEIFECKDINTIFIATRHDSHAKYVLEGIKHSKNIFIEKPLAITEEQLNEIEETVYATNYDKHLQVGFNRRFSKPIKSIKKFFVETKEPMVIHYRVNAGFIPSTHWTQNIDQGGRIIGEGCHFIDTMIYLSGSFPVSVFAKSIISDNLNVNNNDSVSITIQFRNGSVGNLLYLSNGDSSVPKEYCEVYSGNRTAIMENFWVVEFYKNNKVKKEKFDGGKGHKEEINHFINVCTGKEKPRLSFEEIKAVTKTTFMCIESLNRKQSVEV